MNKTLVREIRWLQVLMDTAAIGLAWLASYSVRFVWIGHAQPNIEATFVKWSIPLVLISLYFLAKNRAYDAHSLSSMPSDLMDIIRANALSLVTFIMCLYFVSEARISRLTILIYIVLSTVLLITARVLFRSLIRKLRRRGYLLERVFLVGKAPQVQRYLETVRYTPGTGLKIEAWFDGIEGNEFGVPSRKIEDLSQALDSESPDFVVLGFEGEAGPQITEFIKRYYDRLFQIQVLAPENQSLLGLTMDVVGDSHVLSLNQPRFSRLEIAVKRLFDIVSTGVGLFILAVPLMIIGLAVRLTSPGPVFFGQERVGLNGIRFKMWKFRTMKRAESEEETKQWTVENDPRRTKFGTFLRKTSLDELPQLWNVFVGDMSVIGPRPEQSHFVEKFKDEIPAYMLRHKMKAGITGWAQVSGWRGDTSLHKRIEYDLYYIKNWSLWFDFKILVLTFVKGFVNKNAY